MQSNHNDNPPTIPEDALPRVLIALLKGIVQAESDPALWQYLLDLQPRVRDYMRLIGLDLVLDEAEGHAWLRTRPARDGEPELPRLVNRRQLSFPVSLLLALLRKKLAEFDAGGNDTRLILSRDDIADLLRLFLPTGSNEVKQLKQIDSHINKVVELGFLRRLRGQEHQFEVRRILKAFVDAQWLNEFDQRLAEYQQRLQEDNESLRPAPGQTKNTP